MPVVKRILRLAITTIMSFKNPSKRNQTELSKLVWDLKDAGRNPTIKWYIASKAKPYMCDAKQCQLCLAEKLTFLQADPDTLLNKRSELLSTSRHKTKFKLSKAPMTYSRYSIVVASWINIAQLSCFALVAAYRFSAI